MPLSEDEKLVWLGLKETVSDDTFSGSTPPTNSNDEELTTDDGSPLAGIRVHSEPGQSYDGIDVPAGTAEVFGARVEVSERTPVVESEQPPDTEPVSDPPVDGEPGGDGTGKGDPAAQDIEFTSTLNAVEDLGLDNTGGTSINSGLQGAVDDGTLIEFPAGTYQVDPTDNDGKGVIVNSVTNFGMVGLGDHRKKTRFTLPSGTAGRTFTWGSGASKTYLANCVMDQSTDPGMNIQMTINQGGKFYSYNTGHIGRTAPDPDANPGGEDLSLQTVSMDAGADCRIENYQKTSKALRLLDYPQNQIGLQAPRQHAGTLTVVNAHYANGRSHSIYASRVAGAARVLGGLFHNQTNTNLRICGNGSYAKGASILVDMDPAVAVEEDTGDPQAVRGVRWEAGKYGKTGGYLENCEIIYTSQTGACPGLLRVVGSAGGMEVRDCTIRNETTHTTAFIEKPGTTGATPPKPWDVLFTGCTFTGAGTAPPVVNAAPEDRTVTLEDCTVDMPNAAQPRGVEVVNSG